MFSTAIDIRHRLEGVFDKEQAKVLADVICISYNDLVRASDFNELKSIVRDMAEVQKRTEVKMEELTDAQKETQKDVSRLDRTMKELAEAQKRTEIKVEELAEAQKRTEIKVEELAEAQKRTEIAIEKAETEIQKLAIGLNDTRGDVGGLSRSMGYAFENEAYRMLPVVLKNNYGIEIKEKLIRTEINGKEINILGKARMDDKDIIVVGEAKLRLDERRGKERGVFEELEDKVTAVKQTYNEEIFKILITHYATNGFMKKAKERGIIVVQSFEW